MKIAIAGYGIEGRANYIHWSRQPDAEITIVDQRELSPDEIPESIATITGPDAFQQLNGFDLVVRTASLAPRNIVTDGKVWSATNEFFATCPAPIIGVTGTKGKGTTSSLIVSILEADGRKVWMVGNIGLASLGVLSDIQPEDTVVYELSSFQLWDIVQSPHVAVVLGIEPEHLDVHSDMADYVDAKAHIHRFQKPGDVCVYNPNNDYSRTIGRSEPLVDAVEYSSKSPGSVYVEGGFFYQDEHIICSTEELQLKGEHNKENACAAIAVALKVGVNNDNIAAGIRNFKGLPHRIEYVRTLDGVEYYNDSYSSSTPATVAAVKAFAQPEIIIVGGIDRGGDFESLAAFLAGRENIKEVILIGEIRHKLKEIFGESAPNVPITVMDEQELAPIVRYCYEQAADGDVVILSPGCASFDMFKDFSDRGDQFKKEVLAL